MIRVHHLDVDRVATDPVARPFIVSAMMGFRGDGSQESACATLFDAGFYRLAASLPTNDMEAAWELTNHAANALGDWTTARWFPACGSMPFLPQGPEAPWPIFWNLSPIISAAPCGKVEARRCLPEPGLAARLLLRAWPTR